MHDKFQEYMMQLNADSTLLAKHNANPEMAAQEFGLSSDDVALIAGGDTAAIKKRCGDLESASAQTLITFYSPDTV